MSEITHLPLPFAQPDEILAVTVCATKGYDYAMTAQARAIHANLRHLSHAIKVVLVGDECLKDLVDLYKTLFAAHKAFEVIRIAGFKAPEGLNYKPALQLLIAQMRTAAFTAARSAGATLCWSLDSDVIPKTSNCYRTLRWLLDIPEAFYEVAISPYPSQGGGEFLTGRGVPENSIFPDFRPDERKLTPELEAATKAHKEALLAAKGQYTAELQKEAQVLREEIEKCPPSGNVFEMNAKNGWRRRGWLSAAYPGMGRGAFVHSDWCGFGCTLMSRRALDEADFAGYEGAGTEDLFVVWRRWHQVGIRIGAALHEPSSHVSRRKDKKNFMTSVRFVTEADEGKGECVGHLRAENRPFYAQDRGETYDPQNDGLPVAHEDRPKPADPAAADPKPEK